MRNVIILIILFIILFIEIYYTPRLDFTSKGNLLLWYNKENSRQYLKIY